MGRSDFRLNDRDRHGKDANAHALYSTPGNKQLETGRKNLDKRARKIDKRAQSYAFLPTDKVAQPSSNKRPKSSRKLQA